MLTRAKRRGDFCRYLVSPGTSIRTFERNLFGDEAYLRAGVVHRGRSQEVLKETGPGWVLSGTSEMMSQIIVGFSPIVRG